jgi:large subunit ribosomal protein L7/L12
MLLTIKYRIKMTTNNLDKIVEELSNLTIIEANKLVSTLEEKWGVSASAVTSPSLPTSSAEEDSSAVVEKKSFDLFLESVGTTKIAVIKVVKDICDLGLKSAKELVDKAPIVLKSNVDKTLAEELKVKLEAAGAKVELK